MLRPYTLIYSKIHKVQSFVNHVMLDVVLRAPKLAAPAFSAALVMPKYRMLIDDINADYVLIPLSDAYRICKRLTPQQLKILKKAVHNNNKIRALCDGNLQPVTYEEIRSIDEDLQKAIKAFCDYLYDKVLDLAPCYNQYEEVKGYYKKIIKRSSVCRCCGINKVLTEFHTHRSALDHYLPRQHYPFNSINFKNLLPICDTCNSKYKLGEDPLMRIENKGKKTEKKIKTKAFYPFRRTAPDIAINIALKNVKSLKSLEPANLDIDIKCHGVEEQVDTWDRLFGIKENYKAECCTDEMLAHFEEQYIADMNYGKSHEQYIDLLSKNKYADGNFLKIPFLNAVAIKQN